MKTIIGRKNAFSFLLVFFLLFLASCEYDNSDNNFTEVKPPEENPQMGIDLAGVGEDAVIYLYQNTGLHYTLHTGGRRVMELKYTLDGKEVTSGGDGYIYLGPGAYTDYDDSEHTLTVEMKVSSGTGSLAEAVEAEWYLGKLDFKVVFVKSNFDLNVKQRANTNKNLELYWDKPKLDHIPVKGYQVYKGSTLLAEITNPDQTSIVDPDYVYGYQSYRIVTLLDSKVVPSRETVYNTTYESLKEEHITFSDEALGKSRLKINNPNPYAVQYVLVWLDNIIYTIKDGNVGVVVNRPEFPTWMRAGSLHILPANADPNDFDHYERIFCTFNDLSFGENALFNIAADSKTKMLYGQDLSKVCRYDATTMKLAKATDIGKSFNTGSEVKVSSATGKIAVSDNDGKIYVYKDNTFSTLLATVTPQIWLGVFSITDNDKVVYNDAAGIHVYDINKSEVTYSTAGSNFKVAADGKYLCIFKDNGGSTYDMSGATVSLIKTKTLKDHIDGYYIEINPLNSKQLLISEEGVYNKTYIYDVATLELVKEMDGSFQCVDIFTGNMLFKDKDYETNRLVKIYNQDLSKQLLQMPLANINPSLGGQLINNYLIKDNHYINLSKYLK